MATFAQIVSGQALNVVTGDTAADACGAVFVSGFDGGHPGVPWVLIPDGITSGATSADGKNFTNPPAAPVPTSAPDPYLAAIATLQDEITAITAGIAASSPAAAAAIQAATATSQAASQLPPQGS